MKLNKQQARRVARQDADAAARLLRVQEAQIADLAQRLAATEAALLGACELFVWDHVDPETGEVKKGWQ